METVLISTRYYFDVIINEVERNLCISFDGESERFSCFIGEGGRTYAIGSQTKNDLETAKILVLNFCVNGLKKR